MAKSKPPNPIRARIKSPTWGELHQAAKTVVEILGGPRGTADKLSADSFYVLAILASLDLSVAKSKAPIFGTDYLE